MSKNSLGEVQWKGDVYFLFTAEIIFVAIGGLVFKKAVAEVRD